MLARLATAYVMVGHSERRRLFGMDDETVASTLRAVLRNQMTPICCVGEIEDQRDRGRTEAVLEDQVLAASTGLPAQAGRPGDRLRAGLGHRHRPGRHGGGRRGRRGLHPGSGGQGGRRGGGDGRAHPVRGVGQRGKRRRLLAEPDVDGLLVGGASLDAATFSDIIRAIGGCYRS